MIEASLLDAVLGELNGRSAALADALVGHLRSTFPGVHFTVCSDDDIPPRLTPAAGNDFCKIYYVASGEHCLSLTTDAGAATGLVVALCDGDD